MKIILAGSPEITISCFEEVIKNFDVVAIITQPDKPRGRGMKLQETAVSKLAKKYNIRLFKPNKIIKIKDELKKLNFDILLTFAYGQIIPSSILEIGKHKPINIHGSLLPKYRGAAPVHHAILNGDNEIGITLIEMISQMDAGDMLYKASQKINNKTTTGDGFKIIENLAKTNIVKWLENIKNKKVFPKKQPQNFTLAPKIDKSFGNLQNLTIQEAIRRIRSLNPFPGAFLEINGKRIKIFNISKIETPNSVCLNLNDGKLFAIDYQWESKKRVIL